MPSSNITVRPEKVSFSIFDCGEYTADLARTLDEAVLTVGSVLQTVGYGNKSPVFRALFKVGDTREFVQEVLERIAFGTKMINLLPNPFIPTRPNFACVTPETEAKYKFLKGSAYKSCIRPGQGQAFIIAGTSYIFLCPSFWTRPAWPSFPDCPYVRKNQWVGLGQALTSYRGYLLMHEMVHFYLGGSSLGYPPNSPEVYEMNDCVGLGPYDSLHNPQNYQNYVACRTSRAIRFSFQYQANFS